MHPIFNNNSYAHAVRNELAKTTGRYTPTDDLVKALGMKEEFDKDQELRYIYDGENIEKSTVCMIVDDTSDRRKIALCKKPDVDGYDTDIYSQQEAEEHSATHPFTPIFFGYVPDEATLLLIIACTQWLEPAVITPQ